jgi:two-component system response regulator HydG
MRTNSVAVLDQDFTRRRELSQRLARLCEVHFCCSAGAFLKTIATHSPAVALIGGTPGGVTEAIEAAQRVRELHPGTKVVFVADQSSEGVAVDALRAGVAEYLRAPVTILELSEAVSKFLQCQSDVDDCSELIGTCAPMRELKDLIRRVAPLNSTVLITGETGTGKEVVARLIHRLSARRKAPLVSVNCAAIPDTLLESELFGHEPGAFSGSVRRHTGQIKMADGGSLFLDELGDMSLAAQAKLLRVIEERHVRPLGSSTESPVDIRLIAATHQDLEGLTSDGRFRSDLYYRINVARLEIPPLRLRIADLPALAHHFLRQISQRNGLVVEGFTNAAMARLMAHHWPGNLRELRNVVEMATVVCQSEIISESDLNALRHAGGAGPLKMRTNSSVPLPTLPVKPDADRLLEALTATDWNVTKAAELLHWSRMTVYRRFAKYGMERPAIDPTPLPGEIEDAVKRLAACS